MAADRMQTQRFELKYVVDEPTALAIRGFVDDYLELDEFGMGRPFCAYPVNSLYFDSADLATFRQWVHADRNRFKLRVRFYDARPDSPAFLEIKRRHGDCILKQRSTVRKSAVAQVVAGQLPTHDLLFSRDPKHLVALQNFVSAAQRLRARPKLFVTYLREAYLDPRRNAVRVTLDRHVRITPRETVDFSLHLEDFVQPFGERVIVEIKFTNRFPNWAGQMVRALGLTQQGAAKYCEGVATLWHPHLGHWHSRTPLPAGGGR